MHIAMLSDSDTYGGAAVSASRLAESLSRLECRVTRLVHRSDGKNHLWESQHVAPPSARALTYRVARRLLSPSKRRASDEQAARDRLRRVLAPLGADVINVHNLHGAASVGWSPDLLRVCVDYAPTVWTLHDMWSFTGRCAYSYDCRKFGTGCDAACPTPTEYPALPPDQIAEAWGQRQRLFAACPQLVAVTPSRWLAREAVSGPWAGHRIEVIPYGVPLNIYRPLGRNVSRDILGIDTPGPVLLVAAQSLTERRKGAEVLLKALQQLPHRPLTLVTMGSGRLRVEDDRIYVHSLGYVDQERVRALVYSAADVFVHPAPVDNLPNVVMEAIACGTPVIGFSIGGVPDMVRPAETGWLVGEVLAEGLAETIATALSDLARGLDLRSTCRAIAEADYGMNLQGQRYLSLYRSLGDSESGSPSLSR